MSRCSRCPLNRRGKRGRRALPWRGRGWGHAPRTKANPVMLAKGYTHEVRFDRAAFAKAPFGRQTAPRAEERLAALLKETTDLRVVVTQTRRRGGDVRAYAKSEHDLVQLRFLVEADKLFRIYTLVDEKPEARRPETTAQPSPAQPSPAETPGRPE